ncbi:exodeoxyribonuclease VII large subunit [Paracoccaceae bacterium GXU_MW_L88]
MDLFDDDDNAGGNAPEFSVSELSGAIKRTIEGAFGHVRVRGEVGRVSRPRSGHLYLDLKDDRSVIAAVCWKGVAARLATLPEEGMEVIATGRLTTYGGQSKYQLVIDDIAPAGAGALMAMLEARKKALAAEGLFDESRKKPIPWLPEIIGVVTSPSGAVIRDILHRLRERFPRKVLVWPVAVQGQASAPEVARAIQGFNALTPGGALPRPDLLIVARGGGSVEDLWGFNEEAVVRAAAASEIPLISAVGHETDTTLIDFVSDRRAPTPTAAAEMAVPVRAELMAWLGDQEARRLRAMEARLSRARERLTDLRRGLPRPEALTAEASQKLDYLGDKLPRLLAGSVQTRRTKLAEVNFGRHLLGENLSQKSHQFRQLSRDLEAESHRAIRQRRRDLDALTRRLATQSSPERQTERAAQRRDRLMQIGARLDHAGARPARFAADALRGLTRRLDAQAAPERTEARKERLTQMGLRLDQAGQRRHRAAQDALAALSRVHASLGYEATLERGYAIIRDAEGALIADKASAETRRPAEIEFRDGRVALTPGAEPDGQGRLF